MKKIIAILFIISLSACNNNDKKPADSSNTDVMPSASSGPDTLPRAGGAATGTTGTGTVSDSGNASNPGSDTTYKK